MRVLVTACGAPGAPGIIKSLRTVKEREIELVGTDMNPRAVGFGMVDRGHTVPAGWAPDFVDELLEVVRREKVDVVLPLSTSELVPLSLNRRRFEEIGTKVCVSSAEAIRVANNKVNLYRFLKENGVVVPDFREASTFEEFSGAVRELGYPDTPVCFKPEVSNGGRGFRVLQANADKLHLLLKTKPSNTVATWEDVAPILSAANPFPKLLVSEYLPGMEYSADLLLRGGESLVTIPRSRDVIKLGIAFIGRVEKNGAIIEQAERIARLIGLDYNINMQFKYSQDGIPKIIEINPRVSGTIVLCTGAGVNLPWLAVQLALGETPVIPEPKWGTLMVRYWSEIFYDENGLAYTL
jgi:carbamoyl-phosphate synthase large subunit